jgi:hypothetical protein
MDQLGLEGLELSRKVIGWGKPSKGMAGMGERKLALSGEHLLNNQGNTAIFRAPDPAEMGDSHAVVLIHLQLMPFQLAARATDRGA